MKPRVFGNSKKYLFEPGDYLTKLASVSVEGMSQMEIKNQLSEIIESIVKNSNISKSAINPRILALEETESNGRKMEGHGEILIKKSTSKGEIVAKVPFEISQGQILPFETIKLMNKDFVYSEANLIKVIGAMDKILENPYVLDEDSSYREVVDYQNNTTDAGSLRDVLNVRNESMAMTGTGIDAYAAEIDDLLEKTYDMQPMSRGMRRMIELEAEKIAYEIAKAEFEKVAEDVPNYIEDILQSASVFKRLKDLPWKKASGLEDKASVEIVDVTDNREDLELKKAKLFKSRKLILGHEWGENQNPARLDTTGDHILVDESSNFKVLRKGSKMFDDYMVAATSPEFKVPGITLSKARALEKLTRDHLYLITTPSGVVGPVQIIQKTASFDDMPISIGGEAPGGKKTMPGEVNRVAGQVFEIRSNVVAGDDYYYPKHASYVSAVLSNDHDALSVLSKEDAASIIENLFKTKLERDQFRYGMDGDLFTLRLDTVLIPLKDFIVTPVTSLKDIIFTGSDESLAKVASADKVMIKKPIPDREEYHVFLSKGFDQRRAFRSVGKQEAIMILRNVGVPHGEIVGMLAYLDAGEKEIERLMPLDFSRLDGDDAGQTKTELVRGFMNRLIGPEKAQEMARTVTGEVGKEVLTNQVGDLIAGAGPRVFDAVNTITSFASDAEALADRFEKIAIDHASEDFRALAGLMVATARFDRLIAKVANEGGDVDARSAFSALKATHAAIEKSAAMLLDLSNHQAVLGAEIVGHNTTTQGLRTLDRLNKYASVTF